MLATYRQQGAYWPCLSPLAHVIPGKASTTYLDLNPGRYMQVSLQAPTAVPHIRSRHEPHPCRCQHATTVAGRNSAVDAVDKAPANPQNGQNTCCCWMRLTAGCIATCQRFKCTLFTPWGNPPQPKVPLPCGRSTATETFKPHRMGHDH